MNEKGQLTIVEGDATKPDIKKDEVVIIPHVCNDTGGWGAGFVLAVNSELGGNPEYYYHRSAMQSQKGYKLGFTSFASTNKPDIWVANMIAQHGIIGEKNQRPLRYDALVECMKEVVAIINEADSFKDKKVTIHCPKFGSDLAGGNWDFIVNLIQDIWIDKGIDVTVYEYVPEE